MTFDQERINDLEIRIEHLCSQLSEAKDEIKDLTAQLEGAQKRIDIFQRERLEAAGELLVNIDDAPPGSLPGKLIAANVIMRQERDKARAQVQALLKAGTPVWGEEPNE